MANKTELKKPTETEWARIDQMTDEEIDTSDIPPLDDAFFAAAQRRTPVKTTTTEVDALPDEADRKT